MKAIRPTGTPQAGVMSMSARVNVLADKEFPVMFKATTFLATILVGVAGCAEVETDEDLGLPSEEAMLTVDDETAISDDETDVGGSELAVNAKAQPSTGGAADVAIGDLSAAAAVTPNCKMSAPGTLRWIRKGLKQKVKFDTSIACTQTGSVRYFVSIYKGDEFYGRSGEKTHNMLGPAPKVEASVGAACNHLFPRRTWKAQLTWIATTGSTVKSGTDTREASLACR